MVIPAKQRVRVMNNETELDICSGYSNTLFSLIEPCYKRQYNLQPLLTEDKYKIVQVIREDYVFTFWIGTCII